MTRADRTAAAAAQQSTFELLCESFWDIVGDQIWNIYLVNIHCFLTQECYHKKYMCRRAGPGRYRVYLKIDSFSCRKTDFMIVSITFMMRFVCAILQWISAAGTRPVLLRQLNRREECFIVYVSPHSLLVYLLTIFPTSIPGGSWWGHCSLHCWPLPQLSSHAASGLPTLAWFCSLCVIPNLTLSWGWYSD